MKKITIFIFLLISPFITYAEWIEISNTINDKSSNILDWMIDWVFPNYIETDSFSWSLLWLYEEDRKHSYNQEITLSSVIRSSTWTITSYQSFNPIDLWQEDYTWQFQRANQLLNDIRILLFILTFMFIFFESRKILRIYTFNKWNKWKN